MCTFARRSPSRKLRTAAEVVWSAIRHFGDDGCGRHAAALAFYGVFSIGPFLFIALPIYRMLAGGSDLPLQDVIGYRTEYAGAAGWVGAVALFFSASGAATAMVSSFGRIFSESDQVEKWWRRPLFDRLLGILLVLSGGIVMATFSGASILVAATTEDFEAPIGWAADFAVTWVTAAVMLAAIYRWVPYHYDLPWRPALYGGVVGGLLGALLKSAYASVAKLLGLGDAFAAAGSLVTLMFFIYLAAMALFFGAEVAKVFHKRIKAEQDKYDDLE